MIESIFVALVIAVGVGVAAFAVLVVQRLYRRR